MPIWRKASDKYPSGWQLSRFEGDQREVPLMFKQNVICDLSGKVYSKKNIECLDTSERSFSIEDIKQAYKTGFRDGQGREVDRSDGQIWIEEYFLDKK